MIPMLLQRQGTCYCTLILASELTVAPTAVIYGPRFQEFRNDRSVTIPFYPRLIAAVPQETPKKHGSVAAVKR